MNKAMAKHRNALASLDCVVGKRHGNCEGRIELHHVASGSGKRDDWALVPLCELHHRGPAGLHGLGTKRFMNLYRPPGESEYGLLIWTIQDLAEAQCVS